MSFTENGIFGFFGLYVVFYMKALNMKDLE